MNKFKLNLREVIILLILACPVGLFIYLHNSEKVKYSQSIQSGLAIANNFCDKYTYEVRALGSEIIKEKIKQNLDLGALTDIRIKFRHELQVYEIEINGYLSQKEEINTLYKNIFSQISYLENENFSTLYGSAVNYCNNRKLSIFTKKNAEIISPQPVQSDRYKKINLLIMVFSPLIILYLFFISYNYIKSINNKNY